MPELSSPSALRLRRPGWRNSRLLLGVVLVLVSVVVGAKVVAAADASTRVYVAARDLAGGTTLARGDLALARVRLFSAGLNYIDAQGAAPVGRVLARTVARGELLPAAALVPDDGRPPARQVTVPLAQLHAADVDHGDLADLFATYAEKGAPVRTVPILRRVPVEGRTKSGGTLGGSGTDAGVVLRVPPEQVGPLVAAIQAAKLDLVRVVPGGPVGDVGTLPVLSEQPAPASGDGATAPPRP